MSLFALGIITALQSGWLVWLYREQRDHARAIRQLQQATLHLLNGPRQRPAPPIEVRLAPNGTMQ